MNLKDLKKIKIPDKPGVYFFLKNKPASTRQGEEILYIGKATSLKDRIRSYFGKDLIENRGPLLVDLIFKADEVKWQETDSVLEALILETALIKKYQPKYNTKEKSDKSFNYVCITKNHLRHGVDEHPKVLVIRGKDVKHRVFDKVYGPFTNSSQLKEALKIIRKIFPFLDEKSKNYIEFYRQINLIPDLDDKKIYLQNIKNIKLFFEGKKKDIIKNLKKEMNSFAKKREFEKAGEIKRQLFAIQHINDVALIKNTENNLNGDSFRIEAYDVAHMGGKNMVGVMVVIENDRVEKSEYKKFKIKTQDNTNDTGALKEVLERRFKHTEWQYPNIVVVDGGIAQINLASNLLSKIDKNINTVSVLKDEHHKAKAILGDKTIGLKYKKEILLANSEAHRFAINYHKKLRNKNFIK